jgi:dienelactone hydrolase
MRTQRFLVLAFLLSCAPVRHSSEGSAPRTVEFSSGEVRLKASLWKPTGPGPFPAVLFNHGSGGADAAHTAGMPITEAAERLAPLFLKHGYAFLYLFRRGQGLSADQAPFMRDVLQREEVARGKEARQHLQFILLTTEQLDDVMAALSFLKSVPEVDSRRISLAGHSFGGQLTLLAAASDTTVRAAVAFAAAACAWDRSPELRERLITAVRQTNAAVMLVQAANDYGTSSSLALGDELQRLHKPHLVKIYPPVGSTPDNGHNLLYEAIPQWESDVFEFLATNTRR